MLMNISSSCSVAFLLFFLPEVVSPAFFVVVDELLFEEVLLSVVVLVVVLLFNAVSELFEPVTASLAAASVVPELVALVLVVSVV